MNFLKKYFNKVPEESRSSAAIAAIAALDCIYEANPKVCQSIVQELRDQRNNLKLIASENFSSLAVQLTMGNWMTDKYAEGFPLHRFYAGCDNVDAIEQLAVDELKKLFLCEHAYVQPHSGADANMVAFWSILVHRVQSRELERLGKKTVDELTGEEYEQVRQLMLNQSVMGMSLNSGGHLTHGYRHNLSSKMMKSFPYDVDPKTGRLDYGALQDLVLQHNPAILIAGYSAYPRLINFAKMREIADTVGATLLVDMAHFAGLVAGKVMQGDYNPIPFAHVVTSTTHKTLRGPRGGLVLSCREYAEVINRGCPLVLGGPLPHVMAAKAVAFREANSVAFQKYAKQIVDNSQMLAAQLMRRGVELTTGGTDNHLLVMDVNSSFHLTGRQAESALREARFTVNRNTIPLDSNGPWYTSGVRLGPAALTTLGMGEAEMRAIADEIVALLKATKPMSADKAGEKSRAKVEIAQDALFHAREFVSQLLRKFPLYPELEI